MQRCAPEALYLSQETKATQELYGVGAPATDNFGRQCLLARRFAEAGVRFVQCSHAYWDQHSELAELPMTFIFIAWPVAGVTWALFLGEVFIANFRLLAAKNAG